MRSLLYMVSASLNRKAQQTMATRTATAEAFAFSIPTAYGAVIDVAPALPAKQVTLVRSLVSAITRQRDAAKVAAAAANAAKFANATARDLADVESLGILDGDALAFLQDQARMVEALTAATAVLVTPDADALRDLTRQARGMVDAAELIDLPAGMVAVLSNLADAGDAAAITRLAPTGRTATATRAASTPAKGGGGDVAGMVTVYRDGVSIIVEGERSRLVRLDSLSWRFRKRADIGVTGKALFGDAGWQTIVDAIRRGNSVTVDAGGASYRFDFQA